MKLDPTTMKDWEIAEQSEKNMKKISQIAEELGLNRGGSSYGHYLGKLDYKAILDRLTDKPNGKYIEVTAITLPLSAREKQQRQWVLYRDSAR